MAGSRKTPEQEPESRKLRRPPATTPEARENQMISLAVDLAERQMLEGTASAQVISHYLKLGSSRERLEQQKLANENKLVVAKIENYEANKFSAEMYSKALDAMRTYSGQDVPEVDFED